MSEIGQQVINAVRSKAAQNPTFVYKNPGLSWSNALGPGPFCVYVKDGCPSCLIGQGLWDLKLIDASLENHEYNSVGADDLLAWLDTTQDVTLDVDEIEWLVQVQAAQDAEKPWAEAISFADSYSTEKLNNW
jgi:hypothetical protein